jgi:Nuclease-related domain
MQLASGDPTSRAPGQHVRASSRRLRLRTLVVLGAIAVASAAGARALGVRDVRFLAAELVLALALLGVAHYAVPLVHRRERGAGGEEHVGRLLSSLGEEWVVIHDATIRHGNIDHIVIGPAGVFTVETKSRGGTVRVHDIHGATLRQARADRHVLEAVAGCHVEPLLVFSRAWVDRPFARRGGVRVLPARMLVAHLRGRRRVLSAGEVASTRERIAEALHEHARKRRAARSVASAR